MKKVFFFILFFLFVSLKSYSQTYSDFTLQDLEGNDVKLSKLLEKGPVMISFWATWCSPCKEEMKKLFPVYEKYKDRGFTYLAVNQDNQKSVSKVKSYINANGYSFPVVLDPDKSVLESYSGVGIPYSLLISKDRKIISKHLGYVTGDEIKIESEIKNALSAE
jgi:peroxiredoxin